MLQIKLEEAKSRLQDLISAAINGEEVFIVHEKNQKVQLVSLPSNKPSPCFGNACGLIQMEDDFDAPLDDFSEYME
jgi:antitoxin (DNA-binding transcriptional repressor) of toxin-antitoxin stability system